MKTLSLPLAFISFVITSLSTATTAHALSATQTVLKEIRSTAPSGDVTTRYIEASLVVPGETVVYRLDYINDQDAPVTDMVLTVPVPAEVTFQDGSADQDGVDTQFSADGGLTFTRRADLMVAAESGAMVPAGPDDITHIRWMSVDPVAAEARGQLQFTAVLK